MAVLVALLRLSATQYHVSGSSSMPWVEVNSSKVEVSSSGLPDSVPISVVPALLEPSLRISTSTSASAPALTPSSTESST